MLTAQFSPLTEIASWPLCFGANPKGVVKRRKEASHEQGSTLPGLNCSTCLLMSVLKCWGNTICETKKTSEPMNVFKFFFIFTSTPKVSRAGYCIFQVVHVQSLHFPAHCLQLFVHGRFAMAPECSHQQRRRLPSKGHLAVCPTFIPADHAPPHQPSPRTHMVTPTGMGSPGSGFCSEITSGCSSGPHGCTRRLGSTVPRHFHICCPLCFLIPS